LRPWIKPGSRLSKPAESHAKHIDCFLVAALRADREPRTTLSVLRHLDLVALDANTRKKIADTRAYVKQQFEKYKAKMNPEATEKLR